MSEGHLFQAKPDHRVLGRRMSSRPDADFVFENAHGLENRHHSSKQVHVANIMHIHKYIKVTKLQKYAPKEKSGASTAVNTPADDCCMDPSALKTHV